MVRVQKEYCDDYVILLMRKRKLNIQSYIVKGNYNELSKECSGYVV